MRAPRRKLCVYTEKGRRRLLHPNNNRRRWRRFKSFYIVRYLRVCALWGAWSSSSSSLWYRASAYKRALWFVVSVLLLLNVYHRQEINVTTHAHTVVVYQKKLVDIRGSRRTIKGIGFILFFGVRGLTAQNSKFLIRNSNGMLLRFDKFYIICTAYMHKLSTTRQLNNSFFFNFWALHLFYLIELYDLNLNYMNCLIIWPFF